MNHVKEIASTHWLYASYDNAAAAAFRTVNRRFVQVWLMVLVFDSVLDFTSE